MKLLTGIIFFVSFSCYSQSNDFLLLKKKEKTIATYYVGNHITFTTVNDAYIDADITQIKNDTLYLQQFIIQQVPTTLGVYVLDTTGSYRFQYHYNEIKAIVNAGNHFDLSASGASLMGGGAVIVLASGIVYLADNKIFSPVLMIAGAALAGVGYFIGKNNGKGMTIGKKYKLIYVDASNNKN